MKLLKYITLIISLGTITATEKDGDMIEKFRFFNEIKLTEEQRQEIDELFENEINLTEEQRQEIDELFENEINLTKEQLQEIDELFKNDCETNFDFFDDLNEEKSSQATAFQTPTIERPSIEQANPVTLPTANTIENTNNNTPSEVIATTRPLKITRGSNPPNTISTSPTSLNQNEPETDLPKYYIDTSTWNNGEEFHGFEDHECQTFTPTQEDNTSEQDTSNESISDESGSSFSSSSSDQSDKDDEREEENTQFKTAFRPTIEPPYGMALLDSTFPCITFDKTKYEEFNKWWEQEKAELQKQKQQQSNWFVYKCRAEGCTQKCEGKYNNIPLGYLKEHYQLMHYKDRDHVIYTCQCNNLFKATFLSKLWNKHYTTQHLSGKKIKGICRENTAALQRDTVTIDQVKKTHITGTRKYGVKCPYLGCTEKRTDSSYGRSLEKLNIHIAEIHSPVDHFECDKCNFKTNDKQKRSHHEKSDHRMLQVNIMPLSVYKKQQAIKTLISSIPLIPTYVTAPSLNSGEKFSDSYPHVTYDAVKFSLLEQFLKKLRMQYSAKDQYKITLADNKEFNCDTLSELMHNVKTYIQGKLEIKYKCSCKKARCNITLQELYKHHYKEDHLKKKMPYIQGNIQQDIAIWEKAQQQSLVFCDTSYDHVKWEHVKKCTYPDCDFHPIKCKQEKDSKYYFTLHFLKCHTDLCHETCTVCDFKTNDSRIASAHEKIDHNIYKISVQPSQEQSTYKTDDPLALSVFECSLPIFAPAGNEEARCLDTTSSSRMVSSKSTCSYSPSDDQPSAAEPTKSAHKRKKPSHSSRASAATIGTFAASQAKKGTKRKATEQSEESEEEEEEFTSESEASWHSNTRKKKKGNKPVSPLSKEESDEDSNEEENGSFLFFWHADDKTMRSILTPQKHRCSNPHCKQVTKEEAKSLLKDRLLARRDLTKKS